MSFKKTSDGRVFFKTANDLREGTSQTVLDRPAAAVSSPASEPNQLQVLTLLKTLNERLKITQAERNKMRQQLETYRDLIEEVSAKTDKNEAAFSKVEQRAARADKNAQAAKMMQQEQAQKMAGATTSYIELKKRLAQTESHQKRIDNKINQVAQDRMDFLEKMERIEKAVTQTHRVLAESGLQSLPSPEGTSTTLKQHASSSVQNMQADKRPFWAKSMSLNPVVMMGMLATVLLAGWLINEVQQPQIMMRPAPVITPGTSAVVQTPAEPDWSIQEQAQIQTPPLVKNQAQSYVDDIGTVDLKDEKALVELFEKDETALGRKLSNVEPGNPEQEIVSSSLATAPLVNPVVQKPPPEKLNPSKPESPPPVATGKPDFSQSNPSLPEAIRQVEEKALQGVAEAQHDLAAVYTAGHAGARQDYERAAYWFQKAASQGVANAAYNLGVLYHQGLGVQADLPNAVHWYGEAAKLGHPEAQYNLGIAYIEGIGVDYDPARASVHFERAAANGIIEAAYNLGLIYENGLMGQAEPDKALMWYKAAADKGSPEARSALEQLAKNLDISLSDVNRIAEAMAASSGNLNAVEPAGGSVKKNNR